MINEYEPSPEAGQDPLRNALEIYSHMVKQWFEQDGAIHPTYFIGTEGGWVELPAACEDKDTMMKIVRGMLELLNAVCYVFIDEAWVVGGKPGDPVTPVAPSEHPDRREIVLIMAEDHERQLMGRHYIERPEFGKATLTPLRVEQCNSLEGRMIGLMPRTGTVQ